MPKASYVKFLVTIQRGTGYFEVLEKDSIVVHGTIYSPNEISHHQSSLPPIPLNEEDPTLILEKDEIYKELYLRGYNYSGLFKGISKCDIEASTALVKWESNWSTFMDKMLQLKILQTDTRLLYVPVGIKKLSIDPATHQTFTKNEETLLPVYSYKESNIIKSGGIEIRGLQARSIHRRKSRLAPVLEKYMFLPNNSHLSLKESVRVNVQVILENSLETNFKAVEILDDGTKSQLLSPLIFQALEDLPLITPNLIVSSKTLVQDIPGITIEDFVLVPESNLLLIAGTKILQKTTLKSILAALDSKGFILTREDIDFIPPVTKDLEIMTQHVTGNQKLILLRKVQKTSMPKCIEIFSESLNWLPQLQKALKEESEIVVYSQNQELSGIIGLVNCIRREPKGNKVKCFFMVDEAPEFDTKNPFYGEQLKKNLAINVYMDSQWGTYRHLLLDDLQEVECEHIYGNTTVRGDLSSLKWIEGPLSSTTRTKADKKMIYNYYSSINFKDIMVASGRVNVDVITSDRIEQENILGFEFSGRDLSGRRYCGMINSQAISTQVIGDTSFLWEVPSAWSLEDAATVPVVYSTVSYALLMVTTLKPGTSILIHSATGGIGIAAINVCLYYGCEIFVTVGTHEKREYLKKHYPQIKDDHIGNSRDTSFEEMIKTSTRGRGVDIVLNSLTGDKLKASIRCLGRGGRFMEIGKFDLANDTSLELLLMEREASYHGIMLDQIFIQQPEVKKKLAKIIFDNFENGFVKPLPKTLFEKEKIEDAFRYMTTGKHVGKVLIKIREEEPEKRIQIPKALFKGVPRFNCNTEKTYIIIGGLGGIGMELADWLILRGAKKLVLVSTSGVRNGYQTQRLRIWDSYGVTVQISKADITSPKGCFNLIEEANLLGPIDGIFNLAVVLEDALFEDQSEEKFRISLEPKALATTYLDEITRHLCPNLRYFVIFSSVSCGRGNAGQTNYGMANSIMERICEKRKREGFPALAVQWGAIGEVGLVAKMQKENRELVIGGTLQQKISSCLEVLDKFLKQDSPIVSSMVVAEKHTRNANSSPVDAVAQILGIKDIKTVSQHCILPELGMDSIMGTEIIQVLERDFELYITPKELRNLTLAKLIELEAEGKINKELKNLEDETNVILPELPRGDTCKLPIVRLPTLVSADEEAPTVFLFAGIGGVFNVLEDFTSNLKAHVFGLQYSFENPEDSIQEVAKSMLPLIERNLVKGQSFNIIGYSFGSLVALEVTNLLEDNGFTGNFIAIDGTPAYLAAALKYFVPFGNDAEFQTHLFFKLWTMTFPIEILAPYKEKVIGCSNYNDRIDLLLSLIPEEFKDKFEKKAIIALYKRFKASLDYRFDHDKIKSTAYLFKAKKPIVTDSDASYNLAEVCDNLLQVTTIDGDHLTMLKQQKLFEIVNQLFENM